MGGGGLQEELLRFRRFSLHDGCRVGQSHGNSVTSLSRTEDVQPSPVHLLSAFLGALILKELLTSFLFMLV